MTAIPAVHRSASDLAYGLAVRRLIVTGLIAGLVARLLRPGHDSIGIPGTIILGSFIGGFLQNLIQHRKVSIHSFHPVGIIGSIIGTFVLLLLMRLSGLERGHRR